MVLDLLRNEMKDLRGHTFTIPFPNEEHSKSAKSCCEFHHTMSGPKNPTTVLRCGRTNQHAVFQSQRPISVRELYSEFASAPVALGGHDWQINYSVFALHLL